MSDLEPPEWTTDLRRRLAPLQLGPARETEIIEELSQHLDQRYEELRASGVSRAGGDAPGRRGAAGAGDAGQVTCGRLRQANLPAPIVLGEPRRSWREALGQDLRFAARTLWRQPSFAAAAILTLALGIGVNGAIFALVDATLLRPLPFQNPERLVKVWERTATSARERVAPSNLVDWTQRSRTFDGDRRLSFPASAAW